RTVVLTRDTGTIKIAVDQPEQGRFEAVGYGEGPKDTVFDRPEIVLSQTDWAAVVAHKLAHSGEGH
ncbi:MAG: hypothetical protein JXA89_11955, partial [Anaerolineae bacterium]|nr:hypothetical protein [Anaerolineae bacterium]